MQDVNTELSSLYLILLLLYTPFYKTYYPTLRHDVIIINNVYVYQGLVDQ